MIILTAEVGVIHQEGKMYKYFDPDHIMLYLDAPTSSPCRILLPSVHVHLIPQLCSISQLEDEMNPNFLIYASPEQCGAPQSCDHRSNLYSLGIIFCVCSTGRIPFDLLQSCFGGTEGIVQAHLCEAPSLAPSLPAQLRAILEKLLSKQPAKRYQSAHGLRRDLERCRASLCYPTDGSPPSIPKFPLGEHDAFPFPRFPDLPTYGRQSELVLLHEAHDRVCALRHPEVIVLVGRSGAGKTTLMGAFAVEVVQGCGRVITSHTDPRVPQRSLCDSNWREVLFSLPQNELDRLVARLEARCTAEEMNVGRSAGILPPSSKRSEDPPHQAFLGFYRALVGAACETQPFVALYDTPRDVDLVLAACVGHPTSVPFLAVLPFRTDEYAAASPDFRALGRLRQAGVPVHAIFLSPLTPPSVEEWVQATLVCPAPGVVPRLANALSTLGGGNPHVMRALLEAWHAHGGIALSYEGERPQWVLTPSFSSLTSEADLRALGADLSRPMRIVLSAAACLGLRFGLRALVSALGAPVMPRASPLVYAPMPVSAPSHPCIHGARSVTQDSLGDLEPLAATPASCEALRLSEAETMDCLSALLRLRILKTHGAQEVHEEAADCKQTALAWTHPRVLDAVTSTMLDPADLHAMHVAIGARFVQGILHTRGGEDRLFDAATHLNAALSSAPPTELPSDEYLLALAQLNVRAGHRALHTYGAMYSAITFLSAAHRLLGQLDAAPWDRFGELWFDTTLDLANSLHHTLDLDHALELYRVLLDHLPHERNPYYILAAGAYASLLCKIGNKRNAVSWLWDALLQCGLSLPRTDATPEEMGAQYRALSQEVQSREPLLVSVRTRDANGRTPSEACMTLFYLCRDALDPRALPLAYALGRDQLEHGFSATAPAILSALTAAFIDYHEFDAAAACCRAGVHLLDMPVCRDSPPLLRQMALWIAGYAWGSLGSLSEGVRHLRMCLATCRDAMLTDRIFWAQLMLGLFLIESGAKLDSIYSELCRHSACYAAPEQALYEIVVRLPVMQFTGRTPSVYNFDRVECTESKLKHNLLRFGSSRREATFAASKLRSAVFFRAYDCGIAYIREDLYDDNTGFVRIIHAFYGALCLLGVCDSTHTAPIGRARAIAERLRTLHRLPYLTSLVEGELARLEGRDPWQVFKCYNEALTLANAAGATHIAALSCEYLAHFSMQTDCAASATCFYREALRLYLDWGATSKVRHMLQMSPDSPRPIVSIQSEVSPELFPSVDRATSATPSPKSNQSNAKYSFLSVVDTLAREVELDPLLCCALRLLLEQTGAEKGYVIVSTHGAVAGPNGTSCELPLRNELKVRVVGSGHDAQVIPPTGLDEMEEALCTAVVRSALAQHRTVVLHDASASGAYALDKYILRHAVRSLLCTPVKAKSLTLLLYLESSLSAGAFSRPSCAQYVRFLTTQVTLSLDSAAAYSELAETAEALRSSESLYRTVVQCAPTGIAVWDLTELLAWLDKLPPNLTPLEDEDSIARVFDALLSARAQDSMNECMLKMLGQHALLLDDSLRAGLRTIRDGFRAQLPTFSCEIKLRTEAARQPRHFEFTIWQVGGVGPPTLLCVRDVTTTRIQQQQLEDRVVERTNEVMRLTQAQEELSRCQAIERARREEAISNERRQNEFLRTLCHELRNPLQSAISAVELMDDAAPKLDFEDDRPSTCPCMNRCVVRGYITTLSTVMNHLRLIVDEVLDYSKASNKAIELNPSPLCLISTLKHALTIMSSLSRQRSLTLRLETVLREPLEGSHCVIIADRFRLLQILVNLLSNAIKFSENGEILVTLDAPLVPSREPRALGEGSPQRDLVASGSTPTATATATGMARVSVRDSGIGMSPEQIGRLFQPFRQASRTISSSYGGSGLGLLLSKQLVEMMGGEITIDSASGKGSTFSFTFEFEYAPHATVAPATGTLPFFPPEAIDPSEIIQALGIEEMAPHDKPRVMIVEDNPVVQRLLEAVIRRIGVDVSIASNGLEAVQHDHDQPSDLILMDLEMPVMGGLEATGQILSQRRRRGLQPIPIIAITGNATQEDRRAAFHAGMTEFLTKPILRAELLAMLRRYFPSLPLRS